MALEDEHWQIAALPIVRRRFHLPVVRRVAAVCSLLTGATACASGGGAADVPAGVVLEVAGDAGDKSEVVRFTAAPALLVTEDGQVIYGAPAEAASQGELLVDVWVHSITPTGIAAVVEAMSDDGGPTDISGLAALVGPELGAPRFYLPDRYRFAVAPLGPLAGFDDAAAPVVEWPATASVGLADVDGCITLPELEVGEAFETAAAGSWFVDDDIVYAVVAAPDWPGAPCAVPEFSQLG